MIPDTKEPIIPVKAPNPYKFLADLAAGGVAGGISKTAVAPIERVKLILQTQDSNPRIKSGEIPAYTGDTIMQEQNPVPLLLWCWLQARPALWMQLSHWSSKVACKATICHQHCTLVTITAVHSNRAPLDALIIR